MSGSGCPRILPILLTIRHHLTYHEKDTSLLNILLAVLCRTFSANRGRCTSIFLFATWRNRAFPRDGWSLWLFGSRFWIIKSKPCGIGHVSWKRTGGDSIPAFFKSRCPITWRTLHRRPQEQLCIRQCWLGFQYDTKRTTLENFQLWNWHEPPEQLQFINFLRRNR